MWFKTLTGFEEISPEHVRKNLYMDGIHLVSRVNKQSFQAGTLQTPTLSELKQFAPPLEMYNGQIKVSEIVADVSDLHCNPENKSALFQVASQFNLLEMANPNITPERG